MALPQDPQDDGAQAEALDMDETGGPDDYQDIEEDADGNYIISLGEEEEPDEFFDNLVPTLLGSDNSGWLDTLSLDMLEKVEMDFKAREPRDSLYAEGIKRTGLGNEAPGGAQFLGASRAVHPMLTQAAVDFEARAIKEVFPATGPCKVQITGTATRKRQEKAERIARHINWQATKQITEWRPEFERELMQASLNGDAFEIWSFKDRLKRPSVKAVAADKVAVPFSTADFYSAERITFADDITQAEFDERVAGGMYTYVGDIIKPSMRPDPTKAQEAREKVEGKEAPAQNEDGERRVYMINTNLTGVEERLNGEDADGATPLPYLVYIDDQSYKVLGIFRNWEEKDAKCERMHWIREIPFVPWEMGGIGLVHMIGGLSAAATGALRALLDSAHVNNIPTAAYLKGSGLGGQTKTIAPTQLVEIQGPVGTDDIRKLLMHMPFNEPSTVLYQLLGFVTEAGQSVVRTTFENLSENNTNLPVGTAYALIEQGLTVVSSIMARQHFSMQMALNIIFRLNRMYLKDEDLKDEAGEVLAYAADYQGPMDVVPVSDPGIPSDAHRMAQTQALAQRADLKPQIYNAREVELTILRRLRVAEPERYLVPEQKPTEMNAANENVAATMNRPILAFPEQDHLAHLAAHVAYMQSPIFGFSSIMAPTFIPAMLQHITEHLALWYVNQVYDGIKSAVQEIQGPLAEQPGSIEEFMKMKDSGVQNEFDKMIAEITEDIFSQDGQKQLVEMQLPGIVQQAQQILQQYAPPQPMDPSLALVQTKQMDVQYKTQKDQQERPLKVASLAQQREKQQQATAGQQSAQVAALEKTVRQEEGQDRRLAVQEAHETQRARESLAAKEAINNADNTTALTIAAAEIDSGEKIAESTGGDSNPGS